MFFGGKSKLSTETSGAIKPGSSGSKKRQGTWLSFSRVHQIFPDLPTKTLCTLVELPTFTPSDVLAVVPLASAEQLSKFFDIVEETIPCQDLPIVEVKNKETGADSDCSKTDVVEIPAGCSKKNCRDNNVLVPNIRGEQNITFTFSDDFENKLFRVLGVSKPSPLPDVDPYKLTYDRLRQNPLERCRLENIHAARAHRYGIAHLGPKYLYKENTNLGSKLKTQADRRKFRAGLKGDVDFLNQLNMLDFEEFFRAGSSDGLEALKLLDPVLTSELKNKLKEVPPIELIKFINEEKAGKILKIFDKVKSFAHFSQSMSDYFAHHDALEPALAVVCQMLRQNQNIGAILKDRHTTFLGLAQSFQMLKSNMDRDCVGDQRQKATRSTYRRQSSDRETPRTRKRSNPYEQGFCYHFQKYSSCSKRYCVFPHKCAICRSSRHGKAVCPRKIK